MRNIFLDISSLRGDKVYIDGETCHYLKNVRRIERGTRLSAIIGRTKYSLAVNDISRRFIVCDIVSRDQTKDTQCLRIHVYQGILRPNKMDLVVAKLGEMGIHELFPLKTERTVPRGGVNPSRLIRWSKLAREGAKISGQERIMRVHPPIMLSEIEECLEVEEGEVIFFFSTEIPASPIREVLDSLHYSKRKVFHLIYGPEGGFSEKEVRHILSLKAIPVSLGSLVLRSETAAIVGSGFLRFYYFPHSCQ